MSDNDVWPPRPSLPDPLTEYDELIQTLLTSPSADKPTRSKYSRIRASLVTAEAGQNRLSLVRALREKTGLGLKECLAITNSYCNRNGVVFSHEATAIETKIGCATVVVFWMAMLSIFYLQYLRDTTLSHPHRYAQILALDREARYMLLMLLAMALLQLCIVIRRFRRLR